MYDVIGMPSVMTSTLVVMSSIQQVDTGTVALMTNILGEMTGIVIVLP